MKSIRVRLVALVVVAGFAAAARANPGTTWENQIDGRNRFQVLKEFDGAAVFDKETGLVWERSPAGPLIWSAAQAHCNRLSTGGRLGWRLPVLQELASLVDPNALPGGPMLPPGNPFQDVQSFFPYWSATSFAGDTSQAWVVDLSTANLLGVVKSNALLVWCVRGGQGVDPQ